MIAPSGPARLEHGSNEPGVLKQPRVLWMIVIYNWLTRETQILRHDDQTAWAKVWETKNFAPEEHVYFIETTLPWNPDRGVVFETHAVLKCEEWRTMRPLKEDESYKQYIADWIGNYLTAIVPPHSFSPELGPLETRFDQTKDGVLTFSLPAKRGKGCMQFKVTVEQAE